MTYGMQQPDSFGNRISWSNSWLIFLMESGDPLCYGQHSASSLGVTTFTLPFSGVTTSSSFLMKLPPLLYLLVGLQLHHHSWWSYHLLLRGVTTSSTFLMELPPVLVESPPSFNLLKCEKTTTSIQIMVDSPNLPDNMVKLLPSSTTSWKISYSIILYICGWVCKLEISHHQITTIRFAPSNLYQSLSWSHSC